LKKSKCIDCENNQWAVLEFDHVRGEKIREVSYLMVSSCIEKIQEEIDKCEIRCANCHRLKTMKQFGWARGDSFEEELLDNKQLSFPIF
jgi:hypothetical protein